MTFISDFLAAIAGLPRPLLVLVTGALVLGECTLGLGFLVPGESGLLIASAAVTDLPFFLTLSATVALCAATGDSIGYWLGRRYGFRIRETKAIRRLGQHRWDRASELVRKYGIGAVLVGRFLPFARTMTPAAAGVSGLGYGRFLATSLIGAAAWSFTHVGIGWGAGASAKYIEQVLGRAGGIVLGALVLAGVGVWLWKRSRARKLEAAAQQQPPAEPEDVEAVA
ncbi:membrane protein DedA with SNARE-associated domain [Saccharopolyspora erythraea NRRL 2338]|uniref:DedA-like protein n=2 Tax=Saccharopolyspora erythraea TaxID=1836 RepID=A4FLH1_SACEN|nr:DedA family protein [Saccharopolyspora erythraea]EQD85289.1 membrane protein [Saccharopolyspora erythraea D]PFG98538.1 membrane protein DedA with SNARE-associated domain [Saccharopolyspora erythraea NRRL 2338]QRK88582.1 DedA family protein [Saccharopolyspora erythraea]CAM04896.1 DedA-like protein [Saccharopolyspora erythraea NRRL 2338]